MLRSIETYLCIGRLRGERSSAIVHCSKQPTVPMASLQNNASECLNRGNGLDSIRKGKWT